jgi:hypothetical protein
MKLRHQRKRVLKRISINNAWNWSFDRFVRAVVTASNRMSKAMAEVYAKAREERAQHDHAG